MASVSSLNKYIKRRTKRPSFSFGGNVERQQENVASPKADLHSKNWTGSDMMSLPVKRKEISHRKQSGLCWKMSRWLMNICSNLNLK